MTTARLQGAIGRPSGRTILLAWATALCALAGCKGGSAASDRLKQADNAREDEAIKALEALDTEYATGLTSSFPSHTDVMAPDGTPIMLYWRRQHEQKGWDARAQALSVDYDDTEARKPILQAMLVYRVVHEFWIGRILQGLKTMEELGEEGDRRSNRVQVSVHEYHERLDELGADGVTTPYRDLIDLERILPYAASVYWFRAGGPWLREEDIPFVADVLELAPRSGPAGPPTWLSYQDALCRDLIGAACRVPYELRRYVIMQAYIDAIVRRLRSWIDTHATSRFAALAGRVADDLQQARALARVPEERPRLPSTLGAEVLMRTVVRLVEAGAEVESRSELHDISTGVPSGGPWTWSQAARGALRAELQSALARAEDAGAAEQYSAELTVLADGRAPLSVLPATLVVRDVFLGGRRRHDVLQVGAIVATTWAGQAPPSEVAHTTHASGEPSICQPIASLGGDEWDATRAAATLEIAGEQVVFTVPATEKGAEPVRVVAPLTSDRSKTGTVRTALARHREPVLLALREDATFQQLFELTNGVAYECPEPRCARARFSPKLLLALCRPGELQPLLSPEPPR